MRQKQVQKNHYDFATYITKQRWTSLWHQLNEVSLLKPESILEIGPGPGTFKLNALNVGLNVETVDLDPELEPDHVASATNLPFEDQSYDLVCAFQMLEHLPYDISLQAFNEMIRVTKKNIVISLPDAKTVWEYQIYLPKLGSYSFFIPKPRLKPQEHIFDGEHYWEINKNNYPLNRIIADFSENIRLIKTFRVNQNPYHRFFVFEK